MRKMHWIVSMLVLALILGTGVVIARDNAAKPEEKSVEKSAEKSVAKSKRGLVKPWSMLATLTEDQKDQIIEIHLKANEEINSIRDKEEEDIMALLDDEQRAELQTMQDKAKAEAKAKRAEKKSKEDGGAGTEQKRK